MTIEPHYRTALIMKYRGIFTDLIDNKSLTAEEAYEVFTDALAEIIDERSKGLCKAVDLLHLFKVEDAPKVRGEEPIRLSADDVEHSDYYYDYYRNRSVAD